MTSAPHPRESAPAAPPSGIQPASGVGAVARQPINADRFSAEQLAAARDLEDLIQSRKITPSNIPAWRGRRPRGETFTGPQLSMMRATGIDPASAETLLVSSAVGADEAWFPLGDRSARRVIFTCPILKRRKDEKLLVLSAGGQRKWVYADGTITKGAARGR